MIPRTVMRSTSIPVKEPVSKSHLGKAIPGTISDIRNGHTTIAPTVPPNEMTQGPSGLANTRRHPSDRILIDTFGDRRYSYAADDIGSEDSTTPFSSKTMWREPLAV